MQTYKFNADTKEFLYAEEAFLDPLETEQQGHDIYLLPADSTFTPPLDEKEGYAVCWNGTAWEYIEDHRQKRDMGGVPIEGTGTAYWLPEDTWQSEARYMKELGPLPEGAVTVKPEKSEKEKKLESYRAELSEKEAWLSAHDYIGVKIATGRATAEEYAEEIALMTQYAARIEELRALMADVGSVD